MKPSSAKQKGRLFQQYVVKKLLDKAPDLLPDDITSRSMGAGGEDVLLSPSARERYPYSFECKSVERLNLWDTIKQAESNAGDYTPIIVFKRNRSKAYVIVEFDKWMETA